MQPHLAFFQLAELDERIEAHILGLRVAGVQGWEIAKAALEEIGKPGEVFAAGVLAFESGRRNGSSRSSRWGPPRPRRREG